MQKNGGIVIETSAKMVYVYAFLHYHDKQKGKGRPRQNLLAAYRVWRCIAMMKLNILNMGAFLRVVDACRGPVYRLLPDGTRTDICRRYEVQRELMQAYRQNGNALLLALSVPVPADYHAIVSYYAGDC